MTIDVSNGTSSEEQYVPENKIEDNMTTDNSTSKNNDTTTTESVEEFKLFMYKTQEVRRSIVTELLKSGRVSPDLIAGLHATFELLTNANTKSFLRQMVVNANRRFEINIRDEIVGLEKDISYLKEINRIAETYNLNSLTEIRKKVDLASILARYHPISQEKFYEEVDACTAFLKTYAESAVADGRKPILITDWDGTMKDYCSQYATNLQPVFSAVGMAQFSELFTRLSAVLTAGPLKGPGILDLTALPIDGSMLFSGSWGREWWLKGKRLVHNNDISLEGIDTLNRFNDEMQNLLHDQDYCQFALVGSGVQWKVDRLTLGIQTVCKHVPDDLSHKYQDQIRERMHRVDPNESMLHYDPSTEYEVEVVIHNDGTIWNKANGVALIVKTMNDTLEPPGRILICGDTNSDLPMVEYATSKNPEGTMALFVTMKEDTRNRLAKIVSSGERMCVVSCPDVIHAAMDRVIKQTK